MSEERLEKGNSDDLPPALERHLQSLLGLDRGSPSHLSVTILWALHNSLHGSGGMLDSGK